jgi:CheY-like chemotaxis protein
MDTAKILRILLVEDDSSIAKIIELGMHDLKEPYHLDQALSAEESLELWGGEPYDLVLTDYNLRGMNGLALITTLKKQGATAPMVLFTAYDTPQLRKAARDAGITAFIAKPFFVDQFVSLVRSLLPDRVSEVGLQSPRSSEI